MSLVILLLIWVVFVIFVPSTLASIASDFSSSMSPDEFRERSSKLDNALDELWDEYYSLWEDTSEVLMQKIRLGGEIVTKDAEQQERLHQEFLQQQISQMKRARAVTRASAVTIVQHLFESFEGEGGQLLKVFTYFGI